VWWRHQSRISLRSIRATGRPALLQNRLIDIEPKPHRCCVVIAFSKESAEQRLRSRHRAEVRQQDRADVLRVERGQRVCGHRTIDVPEGCELLGTRSYVIAYGCATGDWKRAIRVVVAIVYERRGRRKVHRPTRRARRRWIPAWSRSDWLCRVRCRTSGLAEDRRPRRQAVPGTRRGLCAACARCVRAPSDPIALCPLPSMMMNHRAGALSMRFKV
jgi:hypothetical protein